MALTIEDGTGVAGADSWATVAEAQAYATARGLTFPSEDAEAEPLMVKAADFILGLEDKFMGYRTNEDQRLPFPRVDVVKPGRGGWFYDTDEIPGILKEAQIRLAIDANTTELRPNGTGQEVLKESVGPISTEYAAGSGFTVSPQFNAAMDLLKPLFGGSGVSLRTFRA